MSQLKLTADGGGGTVSLKGPSSTTGNAAIELTVPGTGSATVDTLGRAGNILQVVQTVKTDTTSYNTIDTWADISGMSVSITPSSSSNKILVTAVLNTGHLASSYYILRLEKGGTPIAVGDASGNRTQGYFGQGPRSNAELIDNTTINFLDTAGSTSAITYNIAWYIAYTTGSTLYLNRCNYDANQDYAPRVISTITAMEVAA